MTKSKIRDVVIIASYLDLDTSLTLAEQILDDSQSVACIIVDDSPVEVVDELRARLIKVQAEANERLFVSTSSLKEGRGGAVRRGMKLGLELFPSAEMFLEMDGDGSHRKQDVWSLLKHSRELETVIGSRYLQASQIVGWSRNRRTFSRVLNIVLPRVLDVGVTDITNGLRRYSRRNVEHLLQHEPLTTSFIYLSETLLVLKGRGALAEVPIVFETRSHGESSVGVRELWASFRGLVRIFPLRKW